MKFARAPWEKRRVTVQLQSDVSECGLACLAMIAAFHGNNTSLREIRRRFQVSDKGVTASQLLGLGLRLQLVGRALKLDLESMKHLTLPCIIHWNFRHFVVLTDITESFARIVDPAIGFRQLSLAEMSNSFTGVALEFFPSTEFRVVAKPPRVRLRDMVGRIYGIRRISLKILGVAVALELVSLAMPLYLQSILDHTIGARDGRLVVPLACAFVALLALQHCINGLRSMMIIDLGQSLNIQWRTNVFIHLLSLPIGFFRKRHLGDLMSKVGAVDAIQKTLTLAFFECVIDGAMASAVITLIFLHSISLGVILAFGTATVLSAKYICLASLKRINQQHLVLSSEQNTYYLETIRGIRTIKLFDSSEKRRGAWSTLLHDQITAGTRVEVQKMLSTLSSTFIFGAERIIFIAIAAQSVLSGGLTLGTMIAIVAYRELFSQRVCLFFDRITEIMLLRVQTERLADIVCTDAEDFNDRELSSGAYSEGTAVIEFQNVEFRHSRFDAIVLSNVNLFVNAGETVAIVGVSGSGKSTLMNLVTGEYAPSKGTIRLFGVGRDVMSRAKYLSMIGVVAQDDILFAGSIAENISFSSDTCDFEWARACSRTSAIDDEIMGMPMGYETLVGDMGSVLSGGQKQRILIARALYKRPKLLLLDEATSHLDLAAERKVSAALKEQGLTVLFIAHRPETIATADRVVELVDGRLIERSK